MTPDQEARFWSKTERLSTGCLVWTAAKSHGYGRFYVEGRLENAHKVAWEHVNGPMPEGLDLDHQCHNDDHSCPGGLECPHRACVEAAHLRPVTRVENLRAHYERVTECPEGHPYDEQNTRVNDRGHRSCRSCHNKRRSEAKVAAKTHCPQGHLYDEANTLVTRAGRRMCLKCAKVRAEQMRSAKFKRPTKAVLLDA